MNRTFGGTNSDLSHSVQRTYDGGYILAGQTYSYGIGSDAWLIKTGANGIETWNRTFGGPLWDTGFSVQQTSDSGYILGGITYSYGNGSGDAWLIKTNTTGFEEWNRTFGGGNYDNIVTINLTTDGGYILSGWTESFGSGSADAWIIKTDVNGREEWNRTFGGPGYDRGGVSVKQTTEGGYVLAGTTESYGAGNGDAWLVKTNEIGIETWNKTFGGTNFDLGLMVQQTSDGGYILAGETESYGAGNSDAGLIKTDANGYEEWIKTFGGTNNDSARQVQQTSDSGYILAGSTKSYGAGKSDAWLIKVSSEGSVHNINKGTDYFTIQSAIDDADPGNEIHVDTGTYYENVNVTKQLTLLGMQIGGDMPIVDANGIWNSITLMSDGITIDGFEAINSSSLSGKAGIKVNSNNNTLKNNIASNNRHGISLSGSNNTLRNNNITNNDLIGILISSSNNNDIGSNFVSNNTIGILLNLSIYNNITENNIINNRWVGIEFTSNMNSIYDNHFNNTNNFLLFFIGTVSSNNWNITKVLGTNIIDGPYLGGNFWAHPNGTGFSQTCTDVERDGICDSPYVLDANNTDFLPLASKRYPVHNINKGTNYSTIQSAIDDAEQGNEILVDSGTYYENVFVYKQLILHGVDTGFGNPVVDAGMNGSPMTLNIDGITIENFTLINSGYNGGYAGISVTSNNNRLINNNVSYNLNGIAVRNFNNNNIITNNNVYNNNGTGILISQTSNNTIQNNTVKSNRFGLRFENSSNNEVLSNIVNLNKWGIIFEDSSSYNKLKDNTVNSNERNGIYLRNYSNENILRNNTANSNNWSGIIIISFSNNNTLSENSVNWNNETGIKLNFSYNNTIYNNNFNNTNNSIFDGTTFNNIWNYTQISGSNIVGGPYLGGNFWAHPNGTGFSQTCADAERDGICDSAYVLDSNNTDFLPLATITSSVHNINKGTNYSTIQSAIDDSSPGDEIHVDSGTYYENVFVNKQLILHGVDTGAGNPVVDAGMSGSPMTLNIDGITIKNFTLINSGNNGGYAGISVNSNNNRLINNNVSYNLDGIAVRNFNNNNIITNNNVNNNNGTGILISQTSNNTIQNNTVKSNRFGLRFENSSNNEVLSNIVNLNKWGIIFEDSSSYNILKDNTVNSNERNGIYLRNYSNENILTNNTANSNNWSGIIIISFSNNNTLSENSVNLNNETGIKLNFSDNNTIYNNYFNNTNNSIFESIGYSNAWNTTKTVGTNIIGGSYLGGNFWANPSGTGFSQTCSDAEWDGICDSPYVLDANNTDYLPLSINFTSTEKVHHINKGTHYSTIQSAIDDASPGDEIHVDSGTYYENVNVNKQLILRGVDTGEGKPVVDSGGAMSAIWISANGIILEKFAAINSSIDMSEGGIKVTSDNNILRDNDLNSNYFGLRLTSSNNNIIENNNFTFNFRAGLRLDYSNYNNITGNNASYNTRPGIRLASSSNNTIADNNVINNVRYGINLGSSSNNNTIAGNYVSNNILAGISLEGFSNNNLIYNNLLNNTYNFRLDGTSQYITWNISKSAGISIIGGSYIGGNFWANPDGMGFSQTCIDADREGICNSPFPLNSNNTDFLPLAAPDAPIVPSQIHGIIFQDINGNGTMDAGESVISNVEVHLTRMVSPGNEFLAGITTTDLYGNYSFSISPGYYRVEEFPADSVQTTPANGMPNQVTLGVGEIKTGINFGNQLINPGEIHGIKFNDFNGNGVMDQGESGIQGVSICIFSWRCTVTDHSGNYSFLNLSPGTYSVHEIVPSGYYATMPWSVTTPVNSSDVKTINFSNYFPVPLPIDISIEQQSGDRNGVPTVYWPDVTVLNITKNLTKISSNIVSVKLIMNFSDGTTKTAYMTQNGSTNIWEANFSQPFPHNSVAHIRFEVDVAPAGTGPEDVIEIGDMIFRDPSGQIKDSCTGIPIRDATVTLFVEYPTGSGNFIESPDENQIPVDNPLITGDDGRYRWDVVPGTYKVRPEVAGYETIQSDPLIIPPPVTDLDISLTPTGGCGISDTTAPDSITNLRNITYVSTYINWTWTDPQDLDFDKVMIYLNGDFQRNITNGTQYYNATVFPGTYTIGTRTVDTSGNINATMVTHTATTILPSIRFINGTVKDNSTGDSLAGVRVSANSTLSTLTNATGFYSFAVTNGTYNLVSTYDIRYYTNTTTVSTIGQALVIQDIELIKKPVGNITGSVTRV